MLVSASGSIEKERNYWYAVLAINNWYAALGRNVWRRNTVNFARKATPQIYLYNHSLIFLVRIMFLTIII